MPGAKSKTRMSTKKTRSAEIKKESVFKKQGSADCAPFTVGGIQIFVGCPRDVVSF